MKLQIECYSDPREIATEVFDKVQRGDITNNDLAQAINNQPELAGKIVTGAASILGDLVGGAKASQSTNLHNLVKGFESTIEILKPLSNSLETSNERLRFAEIVADMIRDYNKAIVLVNDTNNQFWRYTIGGLVTALVAIVGTNQYKKHHIQHNSQLDHKKGWEDFE